MTNRDLEFFYGPFHVSERYVVTAYCENTSRGWVAQCTCLYVLARSSDEFRYYKIRPNCEHSKLAEWGTHKSNKKAIKKNKQTETGKKRQNNEPDIAEP